MSLVDVLDEITAKQVIKTETGDNRIFGTVVGLVTENYHESMKGRVCVKIPVRNENANVFKWARVAMPSGGSKWGHYFLPEVGDQVLLCFEEGNIEKPYIIGCIPKDDSQLISQSADEKNKNKKIVTKHGSSLSFIDSPDDESGAKDQILIETAKQSHRLVLDNENSTVTLGDKDGKNQIKMNTKEGTLEVLAEKNMTVKIGSIELTFNGSNGGVNLKCTSLNVSASSSMKLESSGSASVKGSSGLTMEGGAQAQVKSSGQTSIAGTLIKIG